MLQMVEPLARSKDLRTAMLTNFSVLCHLTLLDSSPGLHSARSLLRLAAMRRKSSSTASILVETKSMFGDGLSFRLLESQCLQGGSKPQSSDLTETLALFAGPSSCVSCAERRSQRHDCDEGPPLPPRCPRRSPDSSPLEPYRPHRSSHPK